jgi:site-specific recombinase XerC
MTVVGERDGFRRWLEARKVSPATVVIYMSAVTRFEAGHADVDLRAVTKQDIEAHAATLRDSGLAPSTVHIWLRGLGRFFEYLVEAQRLLVSPMMGLRLSSPRSLPGRTLTERQADRLLATPNTSLPQGIRDRAVLELCYATGLRRKEVCGLAGLDPIWWTPALSKKRVERGPHVEAAEEANTANALACVQGRHGAARTHRRQRRQPGGSGPGAGR